MLLLITLNPPVNVLNPKASILQREARTAWYRLKHLRDYKINILQGESKRGHFRKRVQRAGPNEIEHTYWLRVLNSFQDL